MLSINFEILQGWVTSESHVPSLVLVLVSVFFFETQFCKLNIYITVWKVLYKRDVNIQATNNIFFLYITTSKNLTE